MRRSLSWSAFLALAVTSAFGLSTAPANAVTPGIAFTATDQPTWQTNGIVWATAQSGGEVFAGGTFSAIRPPGSAAGSNEQSAVNFAAFDAATGDPTNCQLSFTIASGTATVRALAVSPDGKTLYAGGWFGAVNGVPVSSLVAIDIATCTPITTFHPSASATVRTIVATNNAVYFGGDFTTADGATRNDFAAVDPTSGTLLPWDPEGDAPGLAMAMLPNGQDLAIGGDFNNIGGQDSHALAVVDATTGALVHAYPLGFYSATTVVKAIVTDSNNMYIGNEGTGSGVFDGRTAISLSDYSQVWRDTCLGATQALAVYQGMLYSDSHIHDCSSMGEFPDQTRHHLAAEPVTDPHFVQWFPDTNDGIGEGIGPRTLTLSNESGHEYLWVGGEFTTVNGHAQQGLTRFWDGPDDTAPNAPVISSVGSTVGQVKLSWPATTDNDDGTLSYAVYRDGNSQPIWTGSQASTWWQLPGMGYTDTGLTPGSTHTYKVSASDGVNTVYSKTLTVTVPTSTDAYAAQVVSDGASLYWRFGESVGNTAGDSAGSQPGIYHGPVVYGQPGAVPGGNTAVTLNGSSTYIGTGLIQPSPSTFSVETWFKTTTTSGGKLIGFGSDNASSLSSNYDKHIYMTNSGQLVFGVYNNATNTLATSQSYNDGQWHQVVGTQGPNGMALYVDGQLVGTNGVTTNQTYNGYWRVGGDNLSGWPNQPSSNFFAGTIDETSVYPSALSAAQVANQYTLGTPDTTPPSAPTGLAATVDGSGVHLSWTAATDNVGVAGYTVYRSTSASFTPSSSNQVGTSTSTSWTDTSAPAGTDYYEVVANDTSGNAGSPSASVSASVPTVVTLPPTADTYVNAGAPSTNYGTSGSLAVRGSSAYITYLRFALPAAPAGQVLKSATLQVKTSSDASAASADTTTISLVGDGWTETGATYNNRPALGSAVGTLTGTSAIQTVYQTAVDPTQLSSLLGGNADLALTGSGTDNLWLWSKEAPGAATAEPQLILTFGAP